MRLRRIDIRNFRAHEESTIEFNKGINLIIGQNGAGKSSILEAVFAALYLGHPSFPRGYQAVNTRVGSPGFSIILEFEHDGKLYSVERSPGKNVLREDGVIITDKSSEIARWIENNVYPIHVFTNALYIRQGEIEEIITNREIMEKVLRKVLGIENYENAEKNIAEVLRELRRKKEYLRRDIEKKPDVKNSLDEVEKRLLERTKKLEKLKERLEKLKERTKNLEERYSELKELREKLLELEKSVSLRERTIEGEKRLKKELEKSAIEMEEEIKALQIKRERLKELESIEREYELLKRLLLLREEVSKIALKLAKLKQKEESLREKTNKREIMERKLEELKKNAREVAEIYKKLKERNTLYLRTITLLEEVERYKGELEKAGYTVEKLEEELEDIEDAKKRLDDVREEISAIREKMASLRAEREKLLEGMRELEGAKVCPLCKRPIDEHEEEEIKRKYNLELSKLSKEISEYSSKLEDLKGLERELLRKVEREKALLHLKRTADLLLEAQRRLEKVEFEELEKEAQEFERVKEKLIEIRKEINFVEKELGEIREAEKELGKIEKIVDSLEKRKETLMEKVREKGYTSFEEVEKKLEEIEPLHREFLSLKRIPEELEVRRRKLKGILSEIHQKELRLKKLEDDLRNLKKRLERLSRVFSEEEFLRVEKEYMEALKALERTKTELEEGKHLKEEIENLRSELRAKLLEIENAEKELGKIEKAEGDLKILKDKISRLKTEEEVQGLAEVERLAGEMFSEMTDGKYQGIKLKRERKYGRERIELKVLYSSHEVGIEFLSGGERIALGLAFRLALSLYKVGNLELLILDEPTPFLDEERRKKLIEIISNQLRKIPQVIVVSHDEELKDAADYVIRVTNVGGKSRVEVDTLGAY